MTLTTLPARVLQQAKETCPTCEAKDIIKWGKRKGVQVYMCKSCQKTFTDNGALPGKRLPPEHVALAMSAFFSGSSYRDIQDLIDDQYGYRPSTATLYEWVLEYSGRAAQILDKYKVPPGHTWVADETEIRGDEGGTDKGKLWLWSVLSVDSRFLLATHLSKTRTTRDAIILFEKARRRATGPPKEIVTDKLAAYIDGIERVFGADTKHTQSEGIRSKELNNNLSERMQGTIKERTKVMRGLDSIESARKFFDGFALHYNHIKDHDTLKMTPAEAAKIPDVLDSWKEVTHLKPSNVARLTAKPALKAETKPKGKAVAPGKWNFSE